MGGASPYRARFIGLPNGQPSRDSEGVPLGDNGEKYFGLVNLSNTCYVNSVLQALYFCSTFRKAAIKHLSEDKEDDSNGDSLLNSLSELFAQIDSQKRSVGCITPRRFLARVRKANDLFCNAEHQDAHEFMQFLLNDIAENLKARALKQRKRDQQRSQSQQQQAIPPDDDEQPEEEPRTWIHDIFQGYLVNQMKCLCCENVTVRRETFLDLSVDIERHTSIAACLRTFESTELLRSGNKFFCDMCGCLQEAEKRLRIYQLPSVLMLHLKRFKYVERLGRSCRLPYRVVFPLQLRVVEHRPPRRHAAGSPVAKGSHDAGIENTPLSSDGEEPSSPSQPPSRLFELRSVVVHIGRDSSRGHYVTVVRSGDRFVLLDDDVVRVVEPEVLRSFYGTAGGASYPASGGSSSTGHERYPSQHTSSGGWSGNDNADTGNRSSEHSFSSRSTSTPLYERAPEGTCCGYLLLYEAVDGAPDHEATSVLDVGAVADWISEDRNLTDSDSDRSTEDRPGSVPDRPINMTDDSEVTQAFEQRCIPRGPASRNQQYPAGSPLSATPTSAGMAAGQDPRNRAALNSNAGHGGAFAWTAADEEGGRAPTATGNHGAHGVRTLGSVVPAVGSADAVSPSRVNVVTMPSPAGSVVASTEEPDGG